MEHSWILIVAMIGHILCVYADRLLLCTPDGQFSFTDMKDSARMAKRFKDKPESEPLRSIVLGTVAMFLQFLRIEMLVVRKEFQGQGYMRQMMDYAYALADERRIPVILDTDDRDKAARYEHLGMELDRVRSCGEQFHMYDLVREYKERQ